MILPSLFPIDGDEYEDVSGSAPEDLAKDNFTISINEEGSYPVYIVKKEHTVVFDAYKNKYTFEVITTCSTSSKEVRVKISIRCISIEDKKPLAAKPKNVTINWFPKFGKYENIVTKELEVYNYGTNVNYDTYETTEFETEIEYFQNFSKYDSWKTNIDNKTYIFGSNFSDKPGYKKYNNKWYHISYIGETVINGSVSIIFYEDNTFGSNDRKHEAILSIPFSDNPFPVGLPVLNLSVSNITDSSIDYTVLTEYDFSGTISGYLSLMELAKGSNDNSILKWIKDIRIEFTKEDMYDNKFSGTISGLTLLPEKVYYLGSYAGHDSSKNILEGYYDLEHRVTVEDSGRTIEKIPCSKITVNNDYNGIEGTLSINDYDMPFVSDSVQKDENGVYYGGYGINAIPFEYHPTKISSMQLSNDVTDVDLTFNQTSSIKYTAFDVGLTISPSNWSRTNQSFTITSSNRNVISVSPNIASSTSKIFKKTDDTKVKFYARSAGTATLTISTEYSDGSCFSVSLNVTVHVPVSSCDEINEQVNVGIKKIIDFSYNTASGKETTDSILSVESSENVKVNIISDGKQISVVALPYGDSIREETIKCTIGDEYNGVIKTRMFTFNVTLEALPAPEAVLFPSEVPAMLDFEAITQMYNNLTSIMIGLNSISGGRWNEIDALTEMVDISPKYKMSFSDLITELDKIELDIKDLLIPVSNFLRGQDVDYFELHEQESKIRDAIAILYPEYPITALDEIDTASFYTTRIDGDSKINRHEFIQTRYDWCNAIIEALNV